MTEITRIILILILISNSKIASTYYVDDNTGDDNNQGSFSMPWKTISKANDELQPGDTVFIRGGTYNDNINPSRSGTSSQRITYQNYNNENVVIQNIREALDLRNRSYISINGIHFTNIDIYARLVNAHHNYIGYCTFDNMRNYVAWAGFLIDADSHHNWIHHSTISHYGIQNSSNDLGDMINILGSYNLIEDNVIYYGGHALLASRNKFNIIRNNYFHNEPQSHGYGNRLIAVGELNAGSTLIEGNRFCFSGIPTDALHADGVSMHSSDNIVRFNYFYECVGPGLRIKITGDNNATNNHVYNNVFYHNGLETQVHDYQCGLGFKRNPGDNPVYNNIVKNNIFYLNRGGTIRYRNVNAQDQTIENNWETGDPLFVDDESPLDPFNPSIPDFSLHENSPCRDAGV